MPKRYSRPRKYFWSLLSPYPALARPLADDIVNSPCPIAVSRSSAQRCSTHRTSPDRLALRTPSMPEEAPDRTERPSPGCRIQPVAVEPLRSRRIADARHREGELAAG